VERRRQRQMCIRDRLLINCKYNICKNFFYPYDVK
jgi:hypothetical protein